MRYVRKISDFFWKNLVDFNEAWLDEVTLNLHMHAWIFSCLSIALVDGKQNLSEVVFIDRTTGAALLYQILPKTGRQPDGNYSEDSDGFQWQCWVWRPKKACQVCSVKVMVTAFFDSHDVVHHEYVPQGQTITKEYCRDVLHCLCNAVWHKSSELWSTGNSHLHHDGASAHS